jgi:hypothetical protein
MAGPARVEHALDQGVGRLHRPARHRCTASLRPEPSRNVRFRGDRPARSAPHASSDRCAGPATAVPERSASAADAMQDRPHRIAGPSASPTRRAVGSVPRSRVGRVTGALGFKDRQEGGLASRARRRLAGRTCPSARNVCGHARQPTCTGRTRAASRRGPRTRNRFAVTAAKEYRRRPSPRGARPVTVAHARPRHVRKALPQSEHWAPPWPPGRSFAVRGKGARS